MRRVEWTSADEEKLAHLLDRGKSFTEISASFAGRHSRGSVAGKAFRMGLTNGRGKKPAKTRKPTKPAVKKVSTAPRLNPEPVCAFPPDPGPETLIPTLKLQSHHCRAVYGSPGQQRYGHCGAQRVPGTSWCQFHLERYLPGMAVKMRDATGPIEPELEKEVQSC
jgi:hypothetical protein